MGSCLIEVDHVRFEYALELLLVEDEEIVQAFLPHAPQKALADGIGPGCMNRRCEDLDTARFRYTCKARPECAVVMPNEILGFLPIRGSFEKLLCHPGIGGRSSDADMDHSSRLEFDDEERKEWSKEEIADL